MRKTFKYLLILLLLAVLAFFAYDYHMRNSGLMNRIEYENQKDDLGVDYGNSPIEDMIENGRDRRQKRRKRRRKKIKEFFD